jgi:DNA-binding PadR family transcriptional regulator
MSQGSSITPHAALLRVLIPGESEGPELIRKVRDWTEGKIELDDPVFVAVIQELETSGLVEHHLGAADKRTGEPHLTYALTPAGKVSAMAILAASLTRRG